MLFRSMSFRMLQADVLRWAKDKDLLHVENADKQFMKFIEEVFEFKAEMDWIIQSEKSKIEVEYKLSRFKDMKLELGDILVTLIILSEQMDIDLVECLAMAYEKISDRKGKTINGVFVKEEDL